MDKNTYYETVKNMAVEKYYPTAKQIHQIYIY